MIKEGNKLTKFQKAQSKDELVKLPNNEITIIYFYPKADTPGCTRESCEFQDNLSKLNRLKVKVYGVSKDLLKNKTILHKIQFKIQFTV